MSTRVLCVRGCPEKSDEPDRQGHEINKPGQAIAIPCAISLKMNVKHEFQQIPRHISRDTIEERETQGLIVHALHTAYSRFLAVMISEHDNHNDD